MNEIRNDFRDDINEERYITTKDNKFYGGKVIDLGINFLLLYDYKKQENVKINYLEISTIVPLKREGSR